MPQATNFRIFNPDTMAKPTAGYSRSLLSPAELRFTSPGRSRSIPQGNLVGKDDFPSPGRTSLQKSEGSRRSRRSSTANLPYWEEVIDKAHRIDVGTITIVFS